MVGLETVGYGQGDKFGRTTVYMLSNIKSVVILLNICLILAPISLNFYRYNFESLSSKTTTKTKLGRWSLVLIDLYNIKYKKIKTSTFKLKFYAKKKKKFSVKLTIESSASFFAYIFID